MSLIRAYTNLLQEQIDSARNDLNKTNRAIALEKIQVADREMQRMNWIYGRTEEGAVKDE